jgi:hypothetical protein
MDPFPFVRDDALIKLFPDLGGWLLDWTSSNVSAEDLSEFSAKLGSGAELFGTWFELTFCSEHVEVRPIELDGSPAGSVSQIPNEQFSEILVRLRGAIQVEHDKGSAQGLVDT